MNLKLVAVLGVLAVGSSPCVTIAASTDGSISAEEAAIPKCTNEQLILISDTATKITRKKFCESALGVTELLKATPTKEMCDNPSCQVALTMLYGKLPDCKFEDWGIRYTAGRLIKFCGKNPDKLIEDLIEAGSTGGSGAEEATVDWTDSSAGTPTFAPIGGAVTPAPTAAQQATPVTAAPKSAAVSSVAVATPAAALVAVATSFALY